MKKFIVGFLLGAMIFGAVGVHASGGNMIQIFYNIKDIKINKVSKMPSQKPFTYQGTTYVPLRYISDQLGVPVKWEGATQTIHIGQVDDANAFYLGKDLNHMNYKSGNELFNSFNYEYNSRYPIKDNIGNEYTNYLKLEVNDYWGKSDESAWNYIEFPLLKKYKEFVTTVGLTDRSKNTTTDAGILQIIVDGKVVKEITKKAGDMPEEIKVNVNNADKIAFKLTRLDKELGGRVDGNNIIGIGLFDARFYK